MNDNLFTKKSLDKLKSPENLEDYIRVSNPAVWLLLLSIVVLLTGAFVWGYFGQIDSTVPASVFIEDGSAVCYIETENIPSVQTGMTVRFKDYEAIITDIGEKEALGYECTLSKVPPLPNGYYEGKVVVKSAKPLKFILN